MTDENEVNVRVTADSGDLQNGMDEAAKTVEEDSQQMEESGSMVDEAFKKVTETFLGLAALKEIKDFAVGSVEEFAKVQRGSELLTIQIRNQKDSVAGLGTGMKDFLEIEEQFYGHNQAEMLSALNTLELKTHNIAAAQKLMDDAQKLSLLTGKDLHTSVNELGLAYQGNSRGLMMLGKDLGLTKEQSKDAGAEFDKLAVSIKGVETVTQDSQGYIDKMKAAWESFRLEVGEALSPVLRLLSGLLAIVLAAVSTLADVMAGLGYATVATLQLLATGWRHPIDAIKTFGRDLKAISDEWTDHTIENMKRIENAFGFGQDEMTNKLKLMSDKQVAINAEKNQKIGTADKNQAAEDVDGYDEMAKGIAEAAKREGEAWEKEVKKNEMEIRHSLGQASKAVTDFTAASIKGTKSAGEAFTDLAKAIGQTGIDAIAEILNQMGIKDIATAMAMASNPLTEAAAPGYFFSGAIEEGAAATMKGVAASFLASGGVAMSPTLAVIGEREPEAVVPLSRSGDMGFGGNITHEAHYHLPNVQDGRGFMDYMRRGGSRELLDILSNLKLRTGRRASAY